jgi:hypothetical protein
MLFTGAQSRSVCRRVLLAQNSVLRQAYPTLAMLLLLGRRPQQKMHDSHV